MNLDLFIKKNHIFKARTVKEPKISVRSLSVKLGIYTFHKFRFELVYFKFLHSLFKRKVRKNKLVYRREYCWCFIKKNFILSMKSKNSRMGAGVGNLVRLACIVKPGTALILANFGNFMFFKRCAFVFSQKFQVPLKALTDSFWKSVVIVSN